MKQKTSKLIAKYEPLTALQHHVDFTGRSASNPKKNKQRQLKKLWNKRTPKEKAEARKQMEYVNNGTT